ncbi:hypothetical protein ACV341_33980, partial [Pseudomonas aeruginosa]
GGQQDDEQWQAEVKRRSFASSSHCRPSQVRNRWTPVVPHCRAGHLSGWDEGRDGKFSGPTNSPGAASDAGSGKFAD